MKAQKIIAKYNSNNFNSIINNLFWNNIEKNLELSLINAKNTEIECIEYTDFFRFYIHYDGKTEKIDIDNPTKGYDAYLVTVNRSKDSIPVRIILDRRSAIDFYNECIENIQPDDFCANYHLYGQKNGEMKFIL